MKKSEKLEDELPWFYRLVLKLPFASQSLPENLQGIFWAIIVPIFITLEFFIAIFLLILFPFPINIFFASSIPMVIFLIFVKVQLQRLINMWNAEVKQKHFEWDLDKISKEYFSLLKKKLKENESESEEHEKA